MKKKIMDLLVERDLAEDLEKAKALIMAGQVIVNSNRIDKPGTLVKSDSEVRIKFKSKFVSRAGEKLFGAIEHCNLQAKVKGASCLDIGASTGGFTDCLLGLGAKSVTSVDVGTNQLAWKLRSHPQVESMEKTDIRDFASLYKGSGYDFIVGDVSFISLLSLVDSIFKLSGGKASALLLIKPQFEVPKSSVPDGGVVKDTSLVDHSLERVKKGFEEKGFAVLDMFPSRVKGTKGNQEYFLFVKVMDNC